MQLSTAVTTILIFREVFTTEILDMRLCWGGGGGGGGGAMMGLIKYSWERVCTYKLMLEILHHVHDNKNKSDAL